LKIKFDGARRLGFSLIEILVVVLIMGVLIGVAGSLMGGFVANFEMTDDQSLARRRAQDVFNILQTPILNAGLGIPPNHFEYYFAPVSDVGGAPIRTWDGPIQVIPHDKTSAARFNAAENRGDALRVVYSVYSGVKNVNSDDIANFSGEPKQIATPAELPLSGPAPVGGDGIQFAVAGTESVRSYVTFPGIAMHPEMVRNYAGGDTARLTVSGRTPFTVGASGDVLPRNAIRPYHDMLLVRAALAYVDDSGTFCLYDINDDTFNPGPGVSLPTAASADIAGKLVYRVEGIKAVRFVPETNAGGQVTSVNVYVLVEGDNAVTGRTSTSPAVQVVRNRKFPAGSPLAGGRIWPDGQDGIKWDDDMYYEDFEMRWRTRNIEAPVS
jgi:prepilin-type N-terminal cleavage/methylation domain-containing protein